jgi:hypothetical protein
MSVGGVGEITVFLTIPWLWVVALPSWLVLLPDRLATILHFGEVIVLVLFLLIVVMRVKPKT